MLAKLLNSLARRRNAKRNPLACLVCPHVLRDPKSINFLCRIYDGYAASCSETCTDFEAGKDLGMIHLGHLLSLDEKLSDIGGLPINVALEREDNEWTPNYFFEEYQPVEGDFVAPNEGDRLLSIGDDDLVFVFSLGNGDLVTASLDDGFQIVPFWEHADQSSEFQSHLLGTEKLERLPFAKLKSWAKQNGILFLGPNFLCEYFDYALIAK